MKVMTEDELCELGLRTMAVVNKNIYRYLKKKVNLWQVSKMCNVST